MRKLLKLLSIGAFIAYLAGCGHNSGNEPPAEYMAAKQLWTTSDVRDYHFTVRVSCFCPPGVKRAVVVRDGNVHSVTDADSGEPRTASGVPSLDGQFEIADSAYAGSAYRVEFRSDPVLGYLKWLFIDPDESRQDDQIGYLIENLVVDAK